MSAQGSDLYDKEKGSPVPLDAREHVVAEVAPEELYVKRFGRFGPLLAKVFASGVEARGVERVPEDQRENRNLWSK